MEDELRKVKQEISRLSASISKMTEQNKLDLDRQVLGKR